MNIRKILALCHSGGQIIIKGDPLLGAETGLSIVGRPGGGVQAGPAGVVQGGNGQVITNAFCINVHSQVLAVHIHRLTQVQQGSRPAGGFLCAGDLPGIQTFVTVNEGAFVVIAKGGAGENAHCVSSGSACQQVTGCLGGFVCHSLFCSEHAQRQHAKNQGAAQ